MAPKKEPRSSLGRTAKYYRDNPKARKKKAATDKKVNARPEQRAKRSELSIKNKKYDKKYGKAKRAGKDWDHHSQSYVKSKTNRGRKGEGAR
jgi:hypothetical protein